jgi:hypothetical protein
MALTVLYTVLAGLDSLVQVEGAVFLMFALLLAAALHDLDCVLDGLDCLRNGCGCLFEYLD